jgi:multiple sugar transport system ATP-binding protein
VSRVAWHGVEKRFDDVVALSDFTLEVPDGDFLVMLGPSGCGKTTALRILAGLETPTAGAVLLGNREVTRLQPRDRDVAMVFQSYALYPHMSVEENIGYPLKVRGVGKRERAAAVRDAAALLEIDHLLSRRPRQLSGGQRQRVALARAIVRDPACFLMDEPLSNLDAKLRTSMRGEIKRLQKRLGATTVYVTHDQAEATTMADVVAVLHDGILHQVGSPGEIYDRPANRFVGTFVGSPPMNVLTGKVDRGARAFLTGSSALPLPEPVLASRGDVVSLGVRPEDVDLVDADDDDALPGEVYVVEPMGSEALVEVRVGDTLVTARTGRDWERPIGAPIGVRVDARTASFFGGDGRTLVHRQDRPEKSRSDRGQAVIGAGNEAERSP